MKTKRGRFFQLMILVFVLLAALFVAGLIFLRHPRFGAKPAGERLARVEASPHYRDGRFHNRIERPVLTEGTNIFKELYKTLFKKFPRRSPGSPLPSVRTDLKRLPRDRNVLVWFGHSSFYLQLDGVRILVDPVFSGAASPIPGSVKAYAGSDVYTVADMPDIDYLLLSHDHYDHLDYAVAKALRSQVKHVVCGLGAGAHYERWGYAPTQIIERDWGGQVAVAPGFTLFIEPTHHSSGRAFAQDLTLWVAFVIQAPSLTLYYSGDGGSDDRFELLAKKYPRIDWAVMECGQYNKAWQSVHQLPEEVVSSVVTIGAKHVLPVHHSKFTLANHPWDEPLEAMTALSEGRPYQLATPMIGEVVELDRPGQTFTRWWRTVP